MRTTTALSGDPYIDRANIKGAPIAAKRADLRIKLSQLEESGMADTPRGRELRAQIGILDELIGGPCE